MASRSKVAVNEEEDRLCELHRQVLTCHGQLSQRAAYDERRFAALADHDAVRSTLNGRQGREDGSARHHQCRLQTLDEKVESQQQLLLQLQRHKPPLNAALLDDMFQQQKRIAEVSQ